MMNRPETMKMLMPFEIQKAADGKKTFIATKEIIDRDGDKVMVGGLDLKGFKENPVMLWSHDRTVPAIGTWTSIRKTKIDGVPAITMQPEFTKSENHTLARIINDLVDEGVIKAVSISFRPDWETIKFVEGKGKQKGHNIINNGDVHEVSFVNIGANPAALGKALSDGKITQEDIDIYNSSIEEEEVDLLKKIKEQEILIAEQALLLKEKEMDEEIESEFYESIYEAFGVSAPDGEAHEQHTSEDDTLIDDIITTLKQ